MEDKDEEEEEGEGEESKFITSHFYLQKDGIVSTFPVFIVPASMLSHSSNEEEEKPKENAEEEKKEEKKPKDDSPRPRPLHRTCSLFMRSIAPTISKAEIIAVSCTQVAVLMTQVMTHRGHRVICVFQLNILTCFSLLALPAIPWLSACLLV